MRLVMGFRRLESRVQGLPYTLKPYGLGLLAQELSGLSVLRSQARVFKAQKEPQPHLFCRIACITLGPVEKSVVEGLAAEVVFQP